jgi:NADH dehydrogenase FAD-containing subunit
MSAHARDGAVVLGGGIGGLLAARALSEARPRVVTHVLRDAKLRMESLPQPAVLMGEREPAQQLSNLDR